MPAIFFLPSPRLHIVKIPGLDIADLISVQTKEQ